MRQCTELTHIKSAWKPIEPQSTYIYSSARLFTAESRQDHPTVRDVKSCIDQLAFLATSQSLMQSGPTKGFDQMDRQIFNWGIWTAQLCAYSRTRGSPWQMQSPTSLELDYLGLPRRCRHLNNVSSSPCEFRLPTSSRPSAFMNLLSASSVLYGETHCNNHSWEI